MVTDKPIAGGAEIWNSRLGRVHIWWNMRFGEAGRSNITPMSASCQSHFDLL